MDVDPLALAGLVIALLSLAVALLSAGWQITAWVLDGRRVRLALVHGALGRGGAAVGRVERDGRPKNLTHLRDEGFFDEEVIGVSVTNVGRAPVRIDGYGVELVSGEMSFKPVGDAIGPKLPFRLPPGESETWYARAADARALVGSMGHVRHNTERRVRMTVELGTGDTRRTRRSVIVSD